MTVSRKRFSSAFLAVIFIGTLFQADTSAYLDPGSGSMMIQGLIAALAAAGYTLRMYWGRIRQWFKRPKKPLGEPETARTFEHR